MKNSSKHLLYIFCLLATTAFPHSGGTDSSGGHRSSTGYHYHHGCGPHQHFGDTCPYEIIERVIGVLLIPVAIGGFIFYRKLSTASENTKSKLKGNEQS